MKVKQTAIFLYKLTMTRSRSMIRKRYGKDFWIGFKRASDGRFHELINEFEDIGNSMFAFNYAYAPGYVAWYKTMEKLGLHVHERDVLMLLMNEKMLLTVPKPLLHVVGKSYMNGMRKKSREHIRRQENEQLHEFDWTVDYQDVDEERFSIKITDCGFIKYAKKYNATGMLPAICQVDYMIAHYMHVGFNRTQTLGAGCSCCDGCYAMHGECSWNIEQRLQERR